MRLALLNTRAHNIFRPWFYRFSQSQRWVASPCARDRFDALPLRRLHHVALRPYRTLGCFDERLEDEYLGWMDAPRGRQTFVDFFANYHVPAVRRPRRGSWPDRLPDRDHLGRSRPLHPVFDRARTGRTDPAMRR